MATCKNCGKVFDVNTEHGWMEADDGGDICGECVRDAETPDRLEHATRRVDDTPELEQYRDVIFYDWREPDHLEWIATAPIQEIVDWASEIAEATQNEHDATGVDPRLAV